jgi:hypothetical protein
MRHQDARDDSEKVEHLIGDYLSGGLPWWEFPMCSPRFPKVRWRKCS